MASVNDALIRPQLEARRLRLQAAVSLQPPPPEVARLLGEVDAALARLDGGSFGLCETCHDPIEPERLLADPLASFCLDHLDADEQRALERDLELARRVQRGLLPEPDQQLAGWQVHYRYEPAGLVSGDYCDIVRPVGRADSFVVLFGDVSGKGVAAAMLMSHLHAIFRSAAAAVEPVNLLVEHANRVFRESVLSPYYATLVCGRAHNDGRVELCNAGHCLPLIVGASGVSAVAPTGLPVGTFLSCCYTSSAVVLAPGDALVLYTDGLTEARDAHDEEYGVERLTEVLRGHRGASPAAFADACLHDLAAFAGSTRRSDDLTLMVLARSSS